MAMLCLHIKRLGIPANMPQSQSSLPMSKGQWRSRHPRRSHPPPHTSSLVLSSHSLSCWPEDIIEAKDSKLKCDGESMIFSARLAQP